MRGEPSDDTSCGNSALQAATVYVKTQEEKYTETEPASSLVGTRTTEPDSHIPDRVMEEEAGLAVIEKLRHQTSV